MFFILINHTIYDSCMNFQYLKGGLYMFCNKCGAEMVDNVCPSCGATEATEATEATPIMASGDEAYRKAAKEYWYCFLFPLLFFLPILKEKKKVPGNIDVANNALWLFIINIAATAISGFASFLSILPAAVVVLYIVMAVKAYKNDAMKLPTVGDIKIIK